jgi:malonyl-CoA decarboxylase
MARESKPLITTGDSQRDEGTDDTVVTAEGERRRRPGFRRLLGPKKRTGADLGPLFEARGTDVRANKLACAWSAEYQASNAGRRQSMLRELADTFGQFSPGTSEANKLFKRLNAQASGLQFLVALRADMLSWGQLDTNLKRLEQCLEAILSAWFDVGMLELRRLTWDSPASLLEKLIQYEAVHAIKSWDDLRHRVAADRRCYAFFHPKMPYTPLIFVEIAFDEKMSDSVQALLDTQSPSQDMTRARWAIFYSISNTQEGLRGISFGNFLLKRVIEQLLLDHPRLKSFATLSPIPGFSRWLARLSGSEVNHILRGSQDSKNTTPDGKRWVQRLQRGAFSGGNAVLRRAAIKLASHYLQLLRNGQPMDPVARFHLGNGARLERLNWAADLSEKGLQQSCGLMVNYLYALDDLDANLTRLNAGRIPIGRSFGRFAHG